MERISIFMICERHLIKRLLAFSRNVLFVCPKAKCHYLSNLVHAVLMYYSSSSLIIQIKEITMAFEVLI